jgi:hypothetical protein
MTSLPRPISLNQHATIQSSQKKFFSLLLYCPELVGDQKHPNSLFTRGAVITICSCVVSGS